MTAARPALLLAQRGAATGGLIAERGLPGPPGRPILSVMLALVRPALAVLLLVSAGVAVARRPERAAAAAPADDAVVQPAADGAGGGDAGATPDAVVALVRQAAPGPAVLTTHDVAPVTPALPAADLLADAPKTSPPA